MFSPTSHGLNLIASHTTAAASAVSDWVAQHYGLPVQQCYLIRRNLNDNYAVRATDGSRYVARLCAIRPRGAFNVDFEVALLAHLDAKGVGVANRCWLLTEQPASPCRSLRARVRWCCFATARVPCPTRPRNCI